MSFTESLDSLVASNRNGLLGKHESWERVRLGDVATILNGFPFESSRFSRSIGLPLLRIRDVGDRTTDACYEGPYDDEYLIGLGDIVVGMDGDFRAAEWQGPKALLNQRVCKLTTDERILRKKFLLYCLPGYLNAIHQSTSSITVKHLSSRTIADIQIPLPPLHEQDRIVAELEKQFTRLDVGVEALKRLQTHLKRYRASVLKAACEGKLAPTEAELARKEGRDFEPADKLLERILKERRAKWEADQLAKMKAAGKTPKDDRWKAKYQEPEPLQSPPRGSLPEGWTWTTFEQVSRRVTVGHVGPMKDEYVSSGIPFLRSQNVRENRFDSKGLLHISPEFHAKLEKSILRPGDIAVVRSGAVGISCVIPESLEVANCSDLVIVQGPIGLEPRYGAYFLNSVAKRAIKEGQVGIALTHFNTKSVAALALALPPLAEQRRIAEMVEERLSAIDRVEAVIDAGFKRALRLRQSILKRAFEGKLVSQDPTDEPASVLLERMRASSTEPAKPKSTRGRPPKSKTKSAAAQ